MIAPEEETATEPDALEAEAVEEFTEEAEMPEEYSEEYDEGDLEVEEEADEQDDASFDLMSALIDMDGEEITVEELKRGNLRQRDYTRKTQELAETRRMMEEQAQEIERERAQYAQILPALQQAPDELHDRCWLVLSHFEFGNGFLDVPPSPTSYRCRHRPGHFGRRVIEFFAVSIFAVDVVG